MDTRKTTIYKTNDEPRLHGVTLHRICMNLVKCCDSFYKTGTTTPILQILLYFAEDLFRTLNTSHRCLAWSIRRLRKAPTKAFEARHGYKAFDSMVNSPSRNLLHYQCRPSLWPQRLRRDKPERCLRIMTLPHDKWTTQEEAASTLATNMKHESEQLCCLRLVTE